MSFYQFANDKWAALESQPGNELDKRVSDKIDSQLRKEGKTPAAVIHASEQNIIRNKDDDAENPTEDYCSVFSLYTFKFDDTGKWTIIKTHEMFPKEVERREKER